MPVKQKEVDRNRLRLALERKRQVEQAERDKAQKLRSAMDFFHWEVRSVVGYCRGFCDPMLQGIRRLDGYAPFSPLDIVSSSLHDKAQAAYETLLEAEERGDERVKEYWEQPYWQQETRKVVSFANRLRWQEGQRVQFIIWADARYSRRVLGTIDIIDSTIPRFFGDKEDD